MCHHAGALAKKLSSLQVLLPEGGNTSELAAAIDGRSFTLDKNASEFDAVAFRFEKDRIRMSVNMEGKETEFRVGIGCWMKNFFIRKGRRNLGYMTGVWADTNTLFIQCRLVETPYAFSYRFTFLDGRLNMDSRVNLYFDESEWDQDLCW